MINDLSQGKRRDGKLALRWRPQSRGFHLWAVLLLSLTGLYGAICLLLVYHLSHPPGDSMAFWTVARFLITHPAAEIYKSVSLPAGQVALGLDADEPCAYPPSFLLLLWPMGLVTPIASFWGGIALSLPLYLLATVGRRWHSLTMLAALAAPTTAISIVSGQTRLLAPALLIGGFRIIGCRPILAGVLFGLLTYKPQIGILVPFALVSARSWRSIAAACATFIALVLITSEVFGWQIWTTWFFSLSDYWGHVAAGDTKILHLMPAVRSAMLQIGLSPITAWVVQGAASITAMGIVWASFRSGPTPLAMARLFVATFLATPYSFVYDLPIATTAVLWLAIERDRTRDTFGLGELLVLTVATISPIIMTAQTQGWLPIGVLSLCLVLGMLLRSGASQQHGNETGLYERYDGPSQESRGGNGST